MNECALLISIFNLSTLTAIPRRVPGTPMGLNFGLAGGSGGTGLCVWEETDGPISSGSSIPLTITDLRTHSTRLIKNSPAFLPACQYDSMQTRNCQEEERQPTASSASPSRPGAPSNV